MSIARMSVLAVALLFTLTVACSSEDAGQTDSSEPSRIVSDQPTAAPSPASAPVALVATTAPPDSSPPTATAVPKERELEIVTLLPFDAIPAVLDPVFISADEADTKLAELLEDRSRRDTDKALLAGGSDPDDTLVLGLSINGDSRAYYIPTLSRVEIVNDTVGGQPLAVTW